MEHEEKRDVHRLSQVWLIIRPIDFAPRAVILISPQHQHALQRLVESLEDIRSRLCAAGPTIGVPILLHRSFG